MCNSFLYTFTNQSRGIYVLNADKSIILDNIVRMGGTYGKGFQFRNSTNLRIFCNDIESAYGMWVEGNNTTAWDNIGNNRMAGLTNSGIMLNCMRFNWIIPAIDGRFGDIGIPSYDMNNKFYGMVPAEMVCKYSTISCLSYNIHTNSYNLTPANTNCGNFPLCNYFAQNAIIPDIYTCSPPLNIAYKNVIDTVYALRLVRGNVDFSNYSAAAQLELQNLYEKLHTDTNLRTNQPVLDSFYNAYHSGDAIHILQVKNILHSLMGDSISMSDSSSYHSMLNTAYTANESINSNVFSIVHEKNMNNIYIQLLRYGFDSITASQYNAVETLAADCPYSVGRGVYIARFIQSMYKPGITYNDRGICGAAYKNGSPEEDDEIARKKSEEALEKLRILENKIILFPNPATDVLNIKYHLAHNQEGYIHIYNMLGQEQVSLSLNPLATQTSLKIAHLPRGVYIYGYSINGKRYDTGKLIKE